MPQQLILTDVTSGVLTLTLNRPEKLNALSPALLDDLFAALRAAEDDEQVGAVIIKGAGRAFCTGYDITPGPDRQSPSERGIRDDISAMERNQGRWSILWNLNKPTIAQVHGYCVAGGTDLAQHCDMIVAAEDAQFGFPAVRSMGAPPTHMWTYNVGPQWAKYMLLTGDLIDGATAARIGLALKAVPADALEQEARDIAGRMAMIAPDLLAANKSICNKAIEAMGRSLIQQLAIETDAIAHRSPAAAEFSRMAREQGLKAALAWRDDKFRR
jgi:enoyl-CoA hydratase